MPRSVDKPHYLSAADAFRLTLLLPADSGERDRHISSQYLDDRVRGTPPDSEPPDCPLQRHLGRIVDLLLTESDLEGVLVDVRHRHNHASVLHFITEVGPRIRL